MMLIRLETSDEKTSFPTFHKLFLCFVRKCKMGFHEKALQNDIFVPTLKILENLKKKKR